MTEPRSILFFDNGNYSRSPAAEIMGRTLAAKHGLESRFTFASAGLIDKHVGGPPDPRTIEICAAMGYGLDGFICRQATSADFLSHDDIFAMDRQNLAALQLARRDGDRASVALLLGDREVPDPFYGGADGFQTAMDLIERRVKTILNVSG